MLQLHLGPIRDVSPRLLARVGRDAGADVIGDERQAPGLARFLGALERDGTLPRTILYNVNPADNALFAAMAGAFSRPGVASIVQWGPPWWFNDHEQGLRRQLDDLSQIGQLAGFVGMLTDSRSVLSMTRHELFRRVLCDAIGGDLDAGRIAADLEWCSAVVARPLCRQRRPLLLAARRRPRLMAPRRVVIMGVAGSGKSTVAAALAARRGVRLIEADEFHSAANREKMAAGSPLTDDDRWPWLAALRQAMRGEREAVVACSALKRAYRDALRAAGDVGFVYLALERDEVVRRLAARRGHFMGTAMVESQFAALQAPAAEERDVVSVDASGETATVVARVESALVTLAAGTATAPLRSLGGPAAAITARGAPRVRGRARAQRAARRGRSARAARPARPDAAPFTGGRDHGPAVRTALRLRVRGRRAAGAGDACGDERPRGEAPLRRADPVRPDPHPPLARRAGTGRRDRRRGDLGALGRADGRTDRGRGRSSSCSSAGTWSSRSARSSRTR